MTNERKAELDREAEEWARREGAKFGKQVAEQWIRNQQLIDEMKVRANQQGGKNVR